MCRGQRSRGSAAGTEDDPAVRLPGDPQPLSPVRRREAAVLRAYLAAVSRALAGLTVGEEEPPIPVSVTFDSVLGAAEAAAAEGRYAAAIAAAEVISHFGARPETVLAKLVEEMAAE